MSINLNLVRQQIEKLSESSGGGGGNFGDNFWKPTDGEHIIRIVPYKFNPEWPFTEIRQYFIFGKSPVVSPTSHGDPDPIYEFSEQLKNSSNKTERDLGYTLMPRTRYLVPVLVRGLEHEGVKFWAFGKTVYNDLLLLIGNNDYGDVTDPFAGNDLTITYKSGESMKDYSTKILPKPIKTPITEDPAVFNKLDEVPNILETIFKAPTYAEMEATLKTYLSAVTKPTAQAAPPSATPPPTTQSFAATLQAAAAASPNTGVVGGTIPASPTAAPVAEDNSPEAMKAKFAAMFPQKG